MKTVIGVFSDVAEARRTYEELMTLGFQARDISVVTEPTRQSVMRLDNMKPMELGDAGKLAASGPLADVMRTGDGGLSGSLRRLGLSASLADHYASAVRGGETLESVVVEDKDADRVAQVMSRHAARLGETPARSERTELKTAAAATGAGAALAGGAATIKGAVERVAERVKGEPGKKREHFADDLRDEDRSIPVIREELRVGKREIERGHIHVSVHVLEKPVSESINLREERVEVERRTMNRPLRADETELRNEEVDITEYAEEAVIEKEARVVEEVAVHKRITSRDEVISDKLRSTEVDVTSDLGDKVAFKQYLESRGETGGFEEHLQAHEIGRGLRKSGGRWEEIEPNARERWEAKQPGTWERFKESVRYGWSRQKKA